MQQGVLEIPAVTVLAVGSIFFFLLHDESCLFC